MHGTGREYACRRRERGDSVAQGSTSPRAKAASVLQQTPAILLVAPFAPTAFRAAIRRLSARRAFRDVTRRRKGSFLLASPAEGRGENAQMTGFSLLSKIGMETEGREREHVKAQGLHKSCSRAWKRERWRRSGVRSFVAKSIIVAICLNRSIFGIAGYYGIRRTSRQE